MRGVAREYKGGKEGLQEEGTEKVDIFPGAAFKGGEVLLVRPGKEEDSERNAAHGPTSARLA